MTAARRTRVGVGVGLWFGTGLLESLVQLVAVDAGIVEWVAAAAMRQCQFGRHPDVLLLDRVRAAPRGVRDGGPGHHQISPHAVYVECCTQRRDTP